MALNKPLTPLDKEKNGQLIGHHLTEANAHLNEVTAFDLLHAYLQPNMPDQNRLNFGNLVRYYLTLQGKRLNSKNKDRSLMVALTPTFDKPKSISYFKLGLGSKNQHIPKFWVDPERLRLTLIFIGVPAAQVLIKLKLIGAHNVSTVIPQIAEPKVLQMLNLHYSASTHPNTPHTANIKHFGDWVRKTFLTQHGSNKALGLQLAAVTAWSTQSATNKVYCPAEVSMSRLLNGRQGWTLPMLKILAKFATEKTGEAYTSKRIATEYLKWRKENPPK